MKKIVLATDNRGKITELTEGLAPLGYQLVAQAALGVSSIAEIGLTFVENALLKARHAACLTGLPALADDSGLAVEILAGAPGIRSARYAGEHALPEENMAHLLQQLHTVPTSQRQAHAYCALIYLRHANDPTPLICQGIWHGKIAAAMSGRHGFGYDPIFYLSDLGCTAAELSSAQKNQLSHRGQALRQLLTLLPHA